MSEYSKKKLILGANTFNFIASIASKGINNAETDEKESVSSQNNTEKVNEMSFESHFSIELKLDEKESKNETLPSDSLDIEYKF
jgi:hypothetical protein